MSYFTWVHPPPTQPKLKKKKKFIIMYQRKEKEKLPPIPSRIAKLHTQRDAITASFISMYKQNWCFDIDILLNLLWDKNLSCTQNQLGLLSQFNRWEAFFKICLVFHSIQMAHVQHQFQQHSYNFLVFRSEVRFSYYENQTWM